jgi:hypothetical protein
MAEPPTKTQLLEEIEKQRAYLLNLIQELTEEQMIEPNVEENWSIKDLLAHIAAWERLADDRLRAAFTSEELQYPIIQGWDEIHQINADIYEKNKDLSLDTVMKEFETAHNDLLATIESLDDESIFKPLPFDWADGLLVHQLISANTHWHYKDHCESIEKWISKQT